MEHSRVARVDPFVKCRENLPMKISLFPRLALGAAITLGASTSLFAAPADDAPAGLHATPVRTLVPVYPYDELIQGHTGWAEVSFSVEYSGRPILASPVGSSGRAFAKSLLAEVESTEYMPPRRNGDPLFSIAKERYEFKGEAALDPNAKRVLAELRKPKPAIVPADQLDKRPNAIRHDPPVYPYAAYSDGLSGRAEIEVVIDPDGRVLFPHILSATHEDFGWAAASAVSRWKFEPPTRKGEKVDARLTIPFTFDYEKMASSW